MSLFFNKVAIRSVTLLKRDSNTDIFLQKIICYIIKNESVGVRKEKLVHKAGHVS